MGNIIEFDKPAEGEATVCGVYVETDDKTGLATYIYPIRLGGRLSPSLPEIKRHGDLQ